MNEPKIIPFIIYNSDNVKEKKEDSYEEYQIIKEDYCSSPKCGIKSKIVTKTVEKINFSPIEISTNPYFKYCVIPIKDENFKYDFSQSETNHTRNHEEKYQKKYNNISNYQKNSYILLNKNELKEENNENDSENECENECENENICNYLNILEKNKSDLKLTLNNNENVHKDFKDSNIKLKSKKVSLYKGSQNNNGNTNNFHNSIILKQKRKLSLNECSEHKKKNRKIKTSQRNVNNIFILNDENNNNKENKKEERQSNKSKNSSVFQSIKLKKNKIKNIKKNISPFKLTKDKEEPVKVVSSYTTTNINRFKKKKKAKDNKIKRTKTINNIEKLDTNANNNKKEKPKNINLFSDNDNSEEKVKNNNKNNSNNNVYNYSKSQKRPKRIKIKNLGEKPEILKNLINNTRNNSDTKDKIKNNEMYIKRKENNFLNCKIKIENKYKKELFDNPKTAKRRRGSMPEYFRFDDTKQNNILLEVKKEKKNLINKKKSKMFEIDNEKDKDNDKDKEKNKEKGKETIKSKEKENENVIKKMKIKDKKEKKKSKKKEKNKQKLKVKINDLINEKKDKNKYSAKNLKLLFKDLKQKSTNMTARKDRSLTTIDKCNDNFIKNTTSKKLSAYQVTTFSIRNNIKNIRTIKRTESRDINIKKNYGLNLDSSQKLQRCSRRNSTRILFHNKSQKEKITDYTNKQTIKNINEYTKRCLEIIPDLYALEEIPRCKAKIQPILNQNKKTNKIALFDLDETIVHCIGEINMNNVENFTRQCDAKLKVQLPGGKEVTIGINIRPNWEQALDIIKDKYHIIAYTASHESYADSVLNFLDPQQKYFEYRLYRNHCVLCFVDEMKFYVKDLGIFDEFCDLKDVVLIDNSVLSFAYHLDNGIPISPFYDSKDDCELLDISNFLLKYADEDDLRNKLREVYKLSEYLEIIKNNMSEDSFTNSSSISIVKEEEEGERTNKNSYNNKKKNNNSTKNNPTIDNNNENNNNEEKYNNTFSKGKNSSQFLLYKEKFNLFEKIQDYKKRSKSFILGEKKNKPFDSRRVFDNSKNTINKSLELVKKKKKFKSVRYFDINFKKEWNEKQKELNSK